MCLLKVYAIVQSEEGDSGNTLVKFLIPVCDEVGEIPPISTEQALLISSKGVEQKKTEETKGQEKHKKDTIIVRFVFSPNYM